jgi:hypothetical protein
MAIVVVGGHARKIGKTSVVAGIISSLPQYNWTAIKITQDDHDAGPACSGPRDCGTAATGFSVMEEHGASSGTDSARYLQAGAARSFFVRTQPGRLAGAMPRVREELARADNAILESNSILRLLGPDLALMVLDFRVADFKPSAQYFMDRADVVLLASAISTPGPAWPATLLHQIENRPQFPIGPPSYVSGPLVAFVRQRLTGPRQEISIRTAHDMPFK